MRASCPNRARRQARFALTSKAPLSQSLARGLTAARVSGGLLSKVLLRHPARRAGMRNKTLDA
jgi:hypothetical protein